MTPFGREIRKIRIDADLTLGEMAVALGKKPSYMSAVELGDKPLSEELTMAIIGYFKSLPYFKHHRLDERLLMRLADRTRKTVNVQALPDRCRENVAAFARRLPGLSARKQTILNEKLEQILSEVED
jgi:transcriptional regulator with XRE-family HTH domain